MLLLHRMEQQQEVPPQRNGFGGQGPQHYNKTRQIWQQYAHPKVLSGTLQYNDTTIPLLYNRISFCRMENATTVDIYHSYEYADPEQPTSIYHGRWYNFEVPLEEIQVLPNNTFTHIVESYELNEEDYDDEHERFVDATFTVVLTPKLAAHVRSLAQQLPQ